MLSKLKQLFQKASLKIAAPNQKIFKSLFPCKKNEHVTRLCIIFKNKLRNGVFVSFVYQVSADISVPVFNKVCFAMPCFENGGKPFPFTVKANLLC